VLGPLHSIRRAKAWKGEQPFRRILQAQNALTVSFPIY
jgi:hypothetical protein